MYVSVVHVVRGSYQGSKTLDGQSVVSISPLLDSASQQGKPHVLAANAGKSFIGSYVLGLGFTMTPEGAQSLINHDPRNADVPFPYLNGEDLNSRPDQSPSRWVISFFDWPLERAEQYPDCMAIVREKVYPERMRQNREIRKRYWWRYGEQAPALYRTIAPLRRVLVIALTSRTGAFAFVDTGIVFSHAVGVIALDSANSFAILQSAPHIKWA